jgi:hypothetical protein
VRRWFAVAAIVAAPSRALPDERRPLRSSAPISEVVQLLLQGEREPWVDLKPEAEGEVRNSVRVIEFW